VSWLWFAQVTEAQRAGAWASAAVSGADGPEGFLAVWPAPERPRVPAVKVDARIVDPRGAAGEVSLVLAPPRVRIPFDDTAVQQARREVLAGRPPRAISTLLRGDSIFAGAITVDPAGDDPFARIFTAKLLTVGAGLLGAVPAPPGPDIERHGSGAPWPYPSFDA
jgi:hypothetical protein